MSAGAVKAGGVFVEIGADPTKFFAALKGVNKSIGSIGKAMTSAGTKMAAMGAGIVGPIFASAAAFANVGSAPMEVCANTNRANRSVLATCVNSQCLLCLAQVVCCCCSVHGRASFKFQRWELLRCKRLHSRAFLRVLRC